MLGNGASVSGDELIRQEIKKNLAVGVSHALGVLYSSPSMFVSDNGFTAASVTYLVNIAADKVIQLTAANLSEK